MHNNSTSTEKASLVLQLQEEYNNQLSRDSIARRIAWNYNQTRHCTNLLRQISGTTFVFAIITGHLSIITMQLETVKIHVEKHCIVSEKFQKYSLFGMKFFYRMDCKLQRVLAQCIDNSSVSDIPLSI